MKKILVSIVGIGLFMIGGLGIVRAVPLYYTFEGTTRQIVDTAGYAQEAGITFGGYVSYTFLVDFEKQGESTFMDGSVEVHDDVGPLINGYEGNWNRVYVEYIAGNAFSVKFTDKPYQDNAWKQHNWGSIHDWGDTGGIYYDSIV